MKQINTEVLVAAFPIGSSSWQGSRQDLCAERLVPANVVWPTGKAMTSWTDGRWYITLARCRQPGTKGPASAWIAGDWWRLCRTLKDDLDNRMSTARIRQAKRDFDLAVWRESPAYKDQCRRAWLSRGDAQFQTLLAAVTARPESRVRATRSAPATKGQ